MKIAYFGNDFFLNCLDYLIRDGHEIISLYTNECDNHCNFNRSSLIIAERLRCPINYQKPDQQQIDNLVSQGCDLLVSAIYEHKIPTDSKNILRGINIHPAPLPEARGPWVPPLTILQGKSHSATTIHKLEDKLDCGDILYKDEFTVSKNENLESLSCKLQMSALRGLQTIMIDFEQFWNEASPQKEGTYIPFPNDASRILQFSDSIEKIDRMVRAFGKFECTAYFDDKNWLVQDVTVWKENHTFQAGEVVHRNSGEVVIAAPDGLVCLRFLQIHPHFHQSPLDNYLDLPAEYK